MAIGQTWLTATRYLARSSQWQYIGAAAGDGVGWWKEVGVGLDPS